MVLGLIAPKDIHVEQSTSIDATKEQIFPHVQYFEKRNAWYPWMKYDPNMKLETEGEDGTIGAISRWEGNDDVGKGEQSITVIEPNERVETDLQFFEPFESEATTFIQLEETDKGTKVSWGFDSKMPFPFNALSLFMDMTSGVEKDYANGLSMLKEIVEKEAKMPTKYNGYAIQVIDLPSRHFIALEETVPFDQIAASYARNFSKIAAALSANKIEVAGQPCGMFYKWDEENQKIDMAHAIPVASATELNGFTSITLPAGKVLLIDYYGEYDKSISAHEAIDKYLADRGAKNVPPVIEQYITDPSEEPDPAKWLTKIYYTLE